jgi:hypothetical protein
MTSASPMQSKRMYKGWNQFCKYIVKKIVPFSKKKNGGLRMRIMGHKTEIKSRRSRCGKVQEKCGIANNKVET